MPSNLRRAHDLHAELGAEVTAGSLRYALTVEDAVRGADLAIDFVPDELESKLEIFSLLDRMAPPHTILCTPTCALSITDLASCTYRAALCVGLRAVAADLLGEKIEIVRSRFADAEALAQVKAFLARLGMEARVVEDVEDPMLVKNVAR